MAAKAKIPDRKSPALSRKDDEEDRGGKWKGRTFIDFESDDSIPNLTVKTFLRDCFQHPKIFLHKDFQFFRSYLREVGLKLEMAEDATISEDHESTSFCVDKGDKWLEKLKKRVYAANDEDFYWASIIPVRRRSDLGLLKFKWEPLPLSIAFLKLYVAFCRRTTEIVAKKTKKVIGQNLEKVDDYIKEFLQVFDPNRNMDVELRLKGALEGSEYRKRNNLQSPGYADLLHLFKKPKNEHLPVTGSRSRANKRRLRSSDNDGATESDSSSASSDSSGGSEYKGKYTVGKHRKTKRRKVQVAQAKISQGQPARRANNGTTTRSASKPLRIDEILEMPHLYEISIVLKRCTVPSRSNGIVKSSSSDALAAEASRTRSQSQSTTTTTLAPIQADKKPPAISEAATDVQKSSTVTATRSSSRQNAIMRVEEVEATKIVKGPIPATRSNSNTKQNEDTSVEKASSTVDTSKVDEKPIPATRSNSNSKQNPIITKVEETVAGVSNEAIKIPVTTLRSASKQNGVMRADEARSSSPLTNEIVEKPIPSTRSTSKQSLGITIEESASTTTNEVVLKDATAADNSSIAKPIAVTTVEVSNGKSAKKMQPKSSKSKFFCEICWFGKSFPTQTLLDRHMNTLHSSPKRELVVCVCGQRINKSSLEYHQQICTKKTIVNGEKKC